MRAPWRGRSGFELTGWAVLAVVIGGLMVWPWLRVFDGDDDGGGPEPISADAPAADEGTGDEGPGDEPPGEFWTSTTTLTFDLEDYEVGDCLDWDPDDQFQSTDVVECTEPHWMEVIGNVDLDDVDEWPGDTWGAVVDARCTPLVRDYLGVPSDPRFGVMGLYPTEDSWDDGASTLTCGLAPRVHPDERLTEPATAS